MEGGDLVLLLGAGAVGGYIAGLIGVGGGIIFAPVLFFFFQRLGVAPEVLAPLTIGSSLFCTLIASAMSAWFQQRAGTVQGRVAATVGLLSGVAVFLMTRFVTTQPWFDGRAFQLVFGSLLLVVVARMVRKSLTTPSATAESTPDPTRPSLPKLAATGSVAGVVSAAAGVGGGVVLVPAYSGVLRFPISQAVGTSSATIVGIATLGVATNMFLGLGAEVPATAVGYVDVGHALLLAVPAAATARLGVWTSHTISTKWLRLSFAAIAGVVAVRLLWNGLGMG
ncbi:MAG: sulfite exporter TauE/SafE family protein [Bacteroidota bacterium]